MSSFVGQMMGRYHIVEQLGEGGMAIVYKGYDTTLQRNVAIKVIKSDRTEDTSFRKRFEREARALAQLSHPHIVHINDFGEQSGLAYLVMDYISGGTLKTRMGRPMPYQEAARMLAPMAQALGWEARRMGSEPCPMSPPGPASCVEGRHRGKEAHDGSSLPARVPPSHTGAGPVSRRGSLPPRDLRGSSKVGPICHGGGPGGALRRDCRVSRQARTLRPRGGGPAPEPAPGRRPLRTTAGRRLLLAPSSGEGPRRSG